MACQMTEINSFAELHRVLPQIETMKTDIEKRRAWRSHAISQDLRDQIATPFQNIDPASDTYKERMMEMFSMLRKKDYSFDDEGGSVGNVENYLANPIPYRFGDPALIGEFLMSYGHIIKVIGDRTRNLGRMPRVLELGCGQGALSHFLTRSHLDVTCLDISANMTEITRGATRQAHKAPQVVTASFEGFEPDGQYDVVLFYESFHHCLNNNAMVAKYRDALAHGGMLIFAAEPIVPTVSPFVPYPWGLRLDMVSLRAIVLKGWLELGFQRPYFLQMLKRHGLAVEELNVQGIHRCAIVVATRA